MGAAAKLVVGNWKMNGLAAGAAELDAVIAGASETKAQLAICPPATLVAGFAAKAAGSPVRIGGQDCHPEASGAHTGDVSAEMLADAGASWVIVGHSERRADHAETDALVARKAAAAQRAGLSVIVCLGETLAERDAGQAVAVVERQAAESLPSDIDLSRLAVAYEPVWAIGTGRTPSTTDIEEVHGALRAALTGRYGAAAAATPLLYGGSVKPANAAEIFSVENVDGGLIGGASLKAGDFLAIAKAAG